MAIFLVHSTFTLKGNNLFYLRGKITSGTICVGDSVHIPFNSSFGMESQISAVEYLDSNTECHVCLGLRCESADEQELLSGLRLNEGESFEIYKTHNK